MSLRQIIRKIKRLVPLVVICALAYINYSSCYVIVYQEYYLRSRRAVAVVLWVLMGLLQIMLFVYWYAIFYFGCGTYPKFPNFDLYNHNEPGSSEVPFAFFCDEQGYPFWCTRCQNLKPNRTFHSMDVDKCVPKFDHYCMWIGTAIGRDNFVAFVKFLQMFGSYLIVVFSVITASKVEVVRRAPSKLPHYIATFVLDGLMLSMVWALYIMVFVNMVVNVLTIDDMTAKDARVYNRYKDNESKRANTPWWCAERVPRVESGIRYINMSYQETRVVIPILVNNVPYSWGFKKNLVNTMLNGNINDNFSTRPYTTASFVKALFVCFVPFVDLLISYRAKANIPSTYEDCTDKYTPKFIEFLHLKIAAGNFIHASYVNSSNTLSSPEESSA